MKTKINRCGKLLISLFLAFAFLFCGMTPAVTATVRAEEEEQYEKLYYFSDNSESAAYYNGIIKSTIQEYGLTVSDIEYHAWTENFETNFINYSGLDKISNSFIIFEVRKGLNVKLSNGGIFTDYLYDTFSSWKEKNCKIMFICNTDEELFTDLNFVSSSASPAKYYYNDFLEYVDIHINTDILSYFMASIVMIIVAEGNTGYTIILDNNIVYSFEYYFLPYYKKLVGDLSDYPDEETDIYFYLAKYFDIQILVMEDSGNFTDRTNGYIPVSATSLFDAILYDRIYPIGATWDISNFNTWINIIDNMFQEFGIDSTPVYVYNDNGTILGGYEGIKTIRRAGSVFYYVYFTLLDEMIYDFIMGNDLSVYDNWPGKCIVTYKPLSYGSGGWMVGDISEFQHLWKVYGD